jgi:hypothetical protein
LGRFDEGFAQAVECGPVNGMAFDGFLFGDKFF